MTVAVFNAGSSSLKFGLYLRGAPLLAGKVGWNGSGRAETFVRSGDSEWNGAQSVGNYREAVAFALKSMRSVSTAPIQVVSHRVVHGGTALRASVRIDAAVKRALAATVPLAPLHNPPALETLQEAENALPGVPHVAVFDTTYYAQLPAAQSVFPVPYHWYSEWGIRRFGFHGINHAYVAARSHELLGAPGPLRVVSCHLGSGCSATASLGSAAVATTMGFTPLDGLMMATRAGSLDPGMLLYLLREHRLEPEALESALHLECGLKGISGVSGDYREVERAADQGEERAKLALDIYAARVRSAIGSLATSLGGIDALVFTAGVGERSARLRWSVCQGLGFMGVRLDEGRNRAASGESDIGTMGQSPRVLVIPANEEVCLAREAMQVLNPH